MDNSFYKILAIISPFISAILSGFFTYRFLIKGKKFDILYENKIPIFKEFSAFLLKLKTYIYGRTSYLENNEHSPYWEENIEASRYLKALIEIYELNSVFLSRESRKRIQELIEQLLNLKSAELASFNDSSKEIIKGSLDLYLIIETQAENCLQTLYRELNL